MRTAARRAARIRAEDRQVARVVRQLAVAASLTASQPSTPDCRVVDMIVHADQVRVGDLMLTCGVLASVALIEIDLSHAARVHITAHHASLPTGEVSIWRQRHLLVAVRRYVEG